MDARDIPLPSGHTRDAWALVDELYEVVAGLLRYVEHAPHCLGYDNCTCQAASVLSHASALQAVRPVRPPLAEVPRGLLLERIVQQELKRRYPEWATLNELHDTLVAYHPDVDRAEVLKVANDLADAGQLETNRKFQVLWLPAP